MKIVKFLAMLGSVAAFNAPVMGDAIDELNMGLSKTSVFDTPTPGTFTCSDAKPGKNE